MVDKRLLRLVDSAKWNVMKNVLFQWIALLCNIYLIMSAAFFLEEIYAGAFAAQRYVPVAIGAGVALVLRAFMTKAVAVVSTHAGEAIKLTLREKVYQKLMRLGARYTQKAKTAEVLQVMIEGIDQLELYFSKYLPQLFYAVLAPLTLFLVLAPIHIGIAALLFVFVPLIPVAIVLVQKLAKKLLGTYWKSYTNLGNTFLENLQALKMLKSFGADERRSEQMNEDAEAFRVATMRVLVMQLNSISVMDLVAYGGAAVGAIASMAVFAQGSITLGQAVSFLLLAAEFFIPMRMLGSFFHTAMNGMAAADRIFRLLEQDEAVDGEIELTQAGDIAISDVSFSYEEGREVLRHVSMKFKAGTFTAIVGESGSGKSTIASLLTAKRAPKTGAVQIQGRSLADYKEKSILKRVTLLSHNSYIFGGTLRDNLRMGKQDATEEEMICAMQSARLSEFVLAGGNGLDYKIAEGGENLSGGQRQRLAFARALLHDSEVYIFDEATSSIDMESEAALLEAIYELACTKTVIMITHRLENVVSAETIYVLEHGAVAQSGTHELLMKQGGAYASLYDTQRALETYHEWGEEVKHEAV